MIIKIIIAVILMAFVLFLYACSENLTLKPRKDIEGYDFLYDKDHQTKEYEIVKLINYWEGSAQADGFKYLDKIWYDKKHEIYISSLYSPYGDKIIDYPVVDKFGQLKEFTVSAEKVDSLEVLGQTKAPDTNYERLKTLIKPWQNWQDSNFPLEIVYFDKKEKKSRSFMDINNHTRSGWEGIGYFKFRFIDNIFAFKAYTFLSTELSHMSPGIRFSPDIDLFKPAIEDHNIMFLDFAKGDYNLRDIREAGLYVVRRKKQFRSQDEHKM